MQRLRVLDVKQSLLPSALGICNSDTASICAFLNEVIPRLIIAGNESGWWGTWAEMIFNVDQAHPYITAPRGVSRFQAMDVCNQIVNVQNQFYEYLDFGYGHQPGNTCLTPRSSQFMEVYSRNNAVTFIDMPAGSIIRVYPTDSSDVDKRILIQGTDTSDHTVYSRDGTIQVEGVLLDLVGPFQDMPLPLNTLTGLQKDLTIGAVLIYAVNPDTNEQTLISRMEPGETTSWYRRYFINGLPQNCCCVPSACGGTTAQVRALASLEFVPCRVDTDYTLINNLAALTAEAEAKRWEGMDNPAALAMAQNAHTRAIRLLNKELAYYIGNDNVAVNFAPFGSARFSEVMAGMN